MLGIAAVLFVWHLMATNSSAPLPVLSPPGAPRDSTPPITKSFGTAERLPNELDAETFSRMITEFSEPGGYFMYDNHLSNERSYQEPIPSLVKAAKPGGVYLGVGPEQNFSQSQLVLCFECRDVHSRLAAVEELLRKCSGVADG